ncbi:MAG: hypothetical protein EA345_12175 [Halomonas sp.]|nr:MAG: hypothetical protein EA345_12175 [Halomonas sp.]
MPHYVFWVYVSLIDAFYVCVSLSCCYPLSKRLINRRVDAAHFIKAFKRCFGCAPINNAKRVAGRYE